MAVSAFEENPEQPKEKSRVSVSDLDRWLVVRLLHALGRPNVGFALWDGRVQFADEHNSTADVIIHIHDRGALYALLYKPSCTFGRLYSAGRISVQGDLIQGIGVVTRAQNRHALDDGSFRRSIKRILAKRPTSNSQSAARKNVHAHYDLGNDFYSLWLDADYQQYTCAYFPSNVMTLEQAQVAKLDLVCRKLCLQPGDTVVEAGGGWGGLARYLCRHYGVKVQSYNISAEQIAYARAQAKREGLDGIEYIEDDYRNIRGSYDVFVSVGMLEHVGANHYQQLGHIIDRSLKDDGRGLIHSIGQNRPIDMNEWIETYIFPGAYTPTLKQMMEIFEPIDLTVVDVENLRAHYAITLRHWLDRFEANAASVREMFDDNFVRTWRLYLSGSISAFEVGQLQLFQVLFSRQACSVLPATRNHLLLT